MKKPLIFILLILIAFPLFSEEKERIAPLYQALQINLFTMNCADYMTTTFTLAGNYKLREANPIVNLYIRKPLIGVPLTIGISIIQYVLFEKLYYKNRTLGYIALIAINLFKAYILYNNLKVVMK